MAHHFHKSAWNGLFLRNHSQQTGSQNKECLRELTSFSLLSLNYPERCSFVYYSLVFVEQMSHEAHTVTLLPRADVVADSWKDVCAQKPELAPFGNSGAQAAISVYQCRVHEIVVLERTDISALHSLETSASGTKLGVSIADGAVDRTAVTS